MSLAGNTMQTEDKIDKQNLDNGSLMHEYDRRNWKIRSM